MQLGLEFPSDYFVDTSALLNYKPSKLYRAHQLASRGRVYYDADTFDCYISATTFTGLCLPKGKEFLKWYRNHDNPELYVNQKADYGTLMHQLFGQLVKEGKVSDETIEILVKQKLEEKHWDLERAWIHGNGDYCGLRKAIRGFAKFLCDYQVKPIAIEIGLASKIGVATFIDFIAEMTISEKGFFGETYKSGVQKGKPKETKKEKKVRVLINFKSGKNVFDDHILQLAVEQHIWNENFPESRVDEIYNLTPVDYEKEPTYKLIRQTDKVVLPKWQKYLELVPFFRKEVVERSIAIDDSAEVEMGKEPQGISYVNYRDAIIKQHKINYPTEKII